MTVGDWIEVIGIVITAALSVLAILVGVGAAKRSDAERRRQYERIDSMIAELWKLIWSLVREALATRRTLPDDDGDGGQLESDAPSPTRPVAPTGGTARDQTQSALSASAQRLLRDATQPPERGPEQNEDDRRRDHA
jgi:hypothetical protein